MAAPRYSRTARILHWLIAALVVAQIALGLTADKAERPLSDQLLGHHVRIGLLIAALMILRLLWRVSHPAPALPGPVPRWQGWTSRAVHSCLYGLLFVLPISGYILWAWIGRPLDWYHLFSIPIVFTGGDDETWRSIAGYTHEYAAYVLFGLLGLHVGAALWHECWLGDRLIRRML